MQGSCFLPIILGLMAFLYASVGHGGASGYLAAMSLMGVAPTAMKTAALYMNLIVSLSSFYAFWRGGHFKWSLFWPFALASVPMAWLGGGIILPDVIYKKILAVCLMVAIVRMLFTGKTENNIALQKPKLWLQIVAGGSIGLLSGLLGIGGGILLSPLLLLLGWARLKETAAISALFIFVNSAAGLLGSWQSSNMQIDSNLMLGLAFASIGGLLGAYFGSKRFNYNTLRYLLALGLGIACIKLIIS
jgi:uncharacterized protein